MKLIKALKNEIKIKNSKYPKKCQSSSCRFRQKYKLQKITEASNILRSGKLLVATNPDKILPNEKGFQPGAGSIIQSIIEATGPKNKKYLLESQIHF